MKMVIREEVLLSELTAIADDKGNRVTYRELAKKAESIRKYIEERGLVFILCDHQIETLEFIYMMLYLNRVPLLLASDINEEMLGHLMTVYKPQYIYCNNSRGIAGLHRHELELREHILLATGRKRYKIHSDVALLLSTSGTTGSAKLVKLSYANLYDNAKRGCLYLGIQREQKGLSPLPLHHCYGISFCIMYWHCGATVLTTEEMVISRGFCDFYTKERVNNFAATPYTYHMLQKIQFWDQEKLEYLHCAVCGGARMSKQEQRELVSVLKDKFWYLYGLTECTCVILGMNCGGNMVKLGSVGKAIGNIEVEAAHDTNELIVKSKSVCMGYAENSSQLSGGDVNQGVFHTGDIVEIDDDGCIYIKGRLKRYVKILDRTTSLDDIEHYLEEKYLNVEFACIGTDNRISVFYAGTEKMLDKEILILLNRSMKIPSLFVSFVHLGLIPRKETGKIDYCRLEGMI